MKLINITLGVDDINRVVADLERLRQALDSGEIAERIAEEGANAAETAYGFPVSVETSGNQATIIASHEGLSFLEFGAGLTTDESNPYAGMVPYPVYRGSYSDENHGMYAQTGYQYWIFGRNIFDRVIPRGGMMAAGQAIRDNAQDVIREVTGL